MIHKTYEKFHVDSLDINELNKTIVDYVIENLEDKNVDEHVFLLIILFSIFGK